MDRAEELFVRFYNAEVSYARGLNEAEVTARMEHLRESFNEMKARLQAEEFVLQQLKANGK